MNTKTKVLYVCQKLNPYLPEDFESALCRSLPQMIQERKKEIRTFMPRFGLINERRHQLHEVIRLSGKNILINDCDHQLVIKVASIMSARMQVYFIDNDDYFHRKEQLMDSEGVYCADNDERMMFYGKGVIETISKLQWSPDIVHCNSWFSAMTPAFIKLLYNDNPLFTNSKIILSLYDNGFPNELDSGFGDKLLEQGVPKKIVGQIGNPTYENIMRFALQYCECLILPVVDCGENIAAIAQEMGVPVYYISDSEDVAGEYEKIYDEILNK